MIRLLAPFAAALCLAWPAAAQMDGATLGEDYLVGAWSMAGPEGCDSGEALLTFYRSGAWIFTERYGGGEFETIGTWLLATEGLVVTASEYDEPDDLEEAIMPILSAEAGSMIIEEREGRTLQMHRCGE